MGAYTLRVYTWHKCALSSREGASCAIHIYLLGVGFCTSFFELKGPLIPQLTKDG
ncbi:hypothetical protein PREVCOP_06736 [Segatella copri DSM 18205]|uniref:Uncharacterized protein n=1 Tax=Segatella copri DSM 18205 TaxID=537011 RepID=D1PHL6_9BACT|nr:hypothetical protein PREVCOP_06736 [Segatella copri DSM 18205]